MGELGKERKRDHIEVPEQVPQRREVPVETPVPAEPVKVPATPGVPS